MTKNYHRIRRLSLPKVCSFFNDLGGGCPYKCPWFTSKTNGILRFLCNVGTCFCLCKTCTLVCKLWFLCANLRFVGKIRLLTSCGLSLKRNQIGYWITPTKAQKRMPTAANVRRLGANNAQKMGQIGAGFIQYNPVDFDQFNRLDFDTVVTSGQPSLF